MFLLAYGDRQRLRPRRFGSRWQLPRRSRPLGLFCGALQLQGGRGIGASSAFSRSVNSVSLSVTRQWSLPPLILTSSSLMYRKFPRSRARWASAAIRARPERYAVSIFRATGSADKVSQVRKHSSRAAEIAPRSGFSACCNVPEASQSKLNGIQRAGLRAIKTPAELPAARRPPAHRTSQAPWRFPHLWEGKRNVRPLSLEPFA